MPSNIERCWVCMAHDSDDGERSITAVRLSNGDGFGRVPDGFVEVEYVRADIHRRAVEERDWLVRFATVARGWTREQVEAAMARDLAASTNTDGRPRS